MGEGRGSGGGEGEGKREKGRGKGNNEGVWRDAAEAPGKCQSILSLLLLLGESSRGDKDGRPKGRE